MAAHALSRLSKLDIDFNNISVHGFIPSAAPLLNIGLAHAFCRPFCKIRFQNVLEFCDRTWINSGALDEIETWMTAPAEEALKLQQPLAVGMLTIVASGEKKDGETEKSL